MVDAELQRDQVLTLRPRCGVAIPALRSAWRAIADEVLELGAVELHLVGRTCFAWFGAVGVVLRASGGTV